MKQRITLVALAFILYTISLAQAGQERPWTPTQLPPHGVMKDIAARDRYHFWAAGENSTFLYTNDGGSTWDLIRKGHATEWLNAVTYDISTGAIAVGNGGLVVRVQLDAQNPVEQIIDASLTFTGVDAENQDVVLAGHDAQERPVVYRSVDGGVTYTALSISFPNERIVIQGVKFLSSTEVAVFGSVGGDQEMGAPFVLVSHHAGEDWVQSTMPPNNMLITAIERVGANWIAVGIQDSDSCGILRSRDNGATWRFESQPDLGLATDLIRGDGTELIATGMRSIDANGETLVFGTEYRSMDNGRNWGLVDIADGPAFIRMARGGDKIIAVGFLQQCYSRWYDKSLHRSTVTVARKHLELGSIPMGEHRVIELHDVLLNNAPSKREILSIGLQGMNGVSVVSPNVGDFIEATDMQSITLLHERSDEGVVWGVLTLSFDDFTSVAMYVSSNSHDTPVLSTLHPLVESLNFGDVATTSPLVQRFDVFENTGLEAVTFSNITITGDDVIAFAIVDLFETPIVVQPGETFSLDVQFEPHTKGIYHAIAELNTSVGTLRVPVVASCRQDAIDDVLNFGTVPLGEEAEADIFVQHQLWNTEFDVIDVEDPAGAFEVTSTTPLPFNGMPYDRFTVSVKVGAERNERIASIIRIPWTFGSAEPMRVDRRILLAKLGNGDPTSVGEGDVQHVSANVFPLPATQTATVTLPGDAVWNSYRVVDTQGRTVQTGNVGSGTQQLLLDVTEFTPGRYTVIVNAQQKVCTASVVVF